MPGVHLNGYTRVCGAGTIATAKRVYSDGGKLWAINGDVNSHGGGALIAGSRRVFSNGQAIVNHTPDGSAADALCPAPPHCAPVTAQGFSKVVIVD